MIMDILITFNNENYSEDEEDIREAGQSDFDQF